MLRELCQKMNEETCGEIVSHLENLQDEIFRNNELITTNEPSTRTKRGAINFIGGIANSLFGVLDADYASKMSQTIDDIHQNEDHLLNLIKNQTTIIDASLNIMKKGESAITQQFQRINHEMNQLNQQIHGELHGQKITQTFNSLSILTVLIVSNFVRMQSSIISIITDTHSGKLNPLILSPNQLKDEIVKIKSHMPSSLRLPLPLSDIQDYYSLTTVEGRITKLRIIFRLRIPLISLEDFELFKITPIPLRKNNMTFIIKPSTSFLIINLHRDQYYPLTAQELHSCTTIKSTKHLCMQKHPIYRKGSTISACEINLINNMAPPPTCQMAKINNVSFWIQLHQANQWIYSLIEKTTLNVVCEETNTQYTVEGTGILTIKDKCLIKQPLVTIQGHSIYPSNTRVSYFPSTNITEAITFNETHHVGGNFTKENQRFQGQLDTKIKSS